MDESIYTNQYYVPSFLSFLKLIISLTLAFIYILEGINVNSVGVLYIVVNPLLPSAAYIRAKIMISILERIIKKIPYERRDYESVDEKSLS